MKKVDKKTILEDSIVGAGIAINTTKEILLKLTTKANAIAQEIAFRNQDLDKWERLKKEWEAELAGNGYCRCGHVKSKHIPNCYHNMDERSLSFYCHCPKFNAKD